MSVGPWRFAKLAGRVSFVGNYIDGYPSPSPCAQSGLEAPVGMVGLAACG